MMAPDSQVALLLCSHLGLPSGGDAAPLTPREWHALAVKIHASEDKRPAALLGLTTGQLQTRLDASAEEAERLAGLLGRGAALAVELERLESLGIWAITRAGFTVGAAMGRNRLIYALADFALVVSCDAERGGTWAGATEALKAGWVPVFAAEAAELPEGNRRLAQLGALAFPWPFPAPATG